MTEYVFKVYIFKHLHEIILINKNLILLTGKPDSNSTWNTRTGSSSKDFLWVLMISWEPGSQIPVKIPPCRRNPSCYAIFGMLDLFDQFVLDIKIPNLISWFDAYEQWFIIVELQICFHKRLPVFYFILFVLSYPMQPSYWSA